MDSSQIRLINLIEKLSLYPQSVIRDNSEIFDTYKTSIIHNHGRYNFFVSNLLQINDCLTKINTNSGTVSFDKVGENQLVRENNKLKNELLSFNPWRKGPFKVLDIFIDSEWQSNMKWDRIKPHLPNLQDKNICDIGCSNGYYMFRCLEEKPKIIIGFEKVINYVFQFLALKKFAKNENNIFIVPDNFLKFSNNKTNFDLILMLGILYHLKHPNDFMNIVYNKMLSKSTLILETIISHTDQSLFFNKNERYAGMKNVHHILSEKNVIKILKDSGFKNIRCVDKAFTKTNEQRSTEWMGFESLENFLVDDNTTIEGLPAPLRAVFIAEKK